MADVKKTAVIPIDPNGNIILIVPSDEGIARFQVCSQMLCVASPVFRAMLGVNSRFKEATELAAKAGNSVSVPVEITLEDDDPYALGVFLWAVHHKTDRVPGKLTFGQLHKMAVLIDKYDCKEALGVWLEAFWMPEWRNGKDGFCATPETEWPKWLFISYVLGEKDIFKNITKKLILESRLRSGGSKDLVVTDVDDWHWGVPQHILDKIYEFRSKTIAACFSVAISYLDPYQSFDGNQCKDPNATNDERQNCDTINYGFIIRAYKKYGLWPASVQTLCNLSILDLQNLLNNIKIQYFMTTTTYNHRYGSSVRDHSATCDFTIRLRDQVAKAINEIDGFNYDHTFPRKEEKRGKTADGKWDSIQYK